VRHERKTDPEGPFHERVITSPRTIEPAEGQGEQCTDGRTDQDARQVRRTAAMGDRHQHGADGVAARRRRDRGQDVGAGAASGAHHGLARRQDCQRSCRPDGEAQLGAV
jgi:hypothetical protein